MQQYLMWLTKGTSLCHCRYASQVCLSLRHLSHVAFWCFSEGCFSQFKEAQVRRHFWKQWRHCILSLLCSGSQSTALWSALCKRSDDYLKMPLNLKTSLSWLLNSNPGLFLGQHHSTGSTSLTQRFSTPGRRKVPAPSLPAQAPPSTGWVNYSVLNLRTGRLCWAQLCICTMRTLLAWAKTRCIAHNADSKQQGWGIFIPTSNLKWESCCTTGASTELALGTTIQISNFWRTLQSLGHQIQGLQSQQ